MQLVLFSPAAWLGRVRRPCSAVFAALPFESDLLTAPSMQCNPNGLVHSALSTQCLSCNIFVAPSFRSLPYSQNHAVFAAQRLHSLFSQGHPRSNHPRRGSSPSAALVDLSLQRHTRKVQGRLCSQRPLSLECDGEGQLVIRE